MDSYVYCHRRKDNGRCFYIGKGTGRRAWAQHGRSAHWSNVVNKYDYEVVILVNNISEQKAFDLEEQFINEIGLENLVNHRSGGDGGWKLSDETKAKISKFQKSKKLSDETKAKISKAGKGRVVTKETRDKIAKGLRNHTMTKAHCEAISKGKKGKGGKLTEKQVLEVRQITIKKPKIKMYQEIADKYGVSIYTIRDIIKGKTWKHLINNYNE